MGTPASSQLPLVANFGKSETMPIIETNTGVDNARTETLQKVDELVSAAHAKKHAASSFKKRHDDAIAIYVDAYLVFLIVLDSDEAFLHLCSAFLNRKRALPAEKRALAAMQAVTNAQTEDDRKTCSYEAKVLIYAHNLGVSAGGLTDWLSTITTKQAVAAVKAAKAGRGTPSSGNGKRARIIIPCGIDMDGFPLLKAAIADGLTEPWAKAVVPRLEKAFIEIEKALHVAASLNNQKPKRASSDNSCGEVL